MAAREEVRGTTIILNWLIGVGFIAMLGLYGASIEHIPWIVEDLVDKIDNVSNVRRLNY